MLRVASRRGRALRECAAGSAASGSARGFSGSAGFSAGGSGAGSGGRAYAYVSAVAAAGALGYAFREELEQLAMPRAEAFSLTDALTAIGVGGVDKAAPVDIPAALAKIREVKKSHPENIAMAVFDEAYFNTLSEDGKQALLRCVRTGMENPDSNMGCYAMYPEDYDRFKPFFAKALARYHKVAENAVHKTDWKLAGVRGLPAGGKLDLTALGLPAMSMRVRVGRNLKDFPLPGAMEAEDRKAMENKMCQAFDKLIAMPDYGGQYYSLTPGHKNHIDDAKYKELVKKHQMFKDMADDTYLASAGIASDWPVGRGCYVSGDQGFIIWVGEEDHLRIMCMEKGTLLNGVFDRLKTALDTVETIDGMKFAHSPTVGYVTSCPTNLGTGMRASVHMKCPNLTKDGTDAACKAVCKPLGLSVRGLGGEHTPIGADGTVDISPSARFCITEAQIITALYKGISNLKKEEDKA